MCNTHYQDILGRGKKSRGSFVQGNIATNKRTSSLEVLLGPASQVWLVMSFAQMGSQSAQVVPGHRTHTLAEQAFAVIAGDGRREVTVA